MPGNRYTPDNLNCDPVGRVWELFRNYQALTYAVYRCEVLQHVFDNIRGVKSLLAREYRLHPAFFDAAPPSREPIARSEIQHLVSCMDMFGL